MGVDERSLERLVPTSLRSGDRTGLETLALHLERYRFAARNARPGRLLDLACGVGYGTRLLADEIQGLEEAWGVDLSPEAVAYGRAHYCGRGVQFAAADAFAYQDPAGFDTIVSLETVEHLPDPARLVSHLVSLLRPGGRLIASVPTTPSVDVNPHHRHDFTELSFRRLFADHPLSERGCLRQVQHFSLGPLLRRSEARLGDLRPGLARWYATHPGALLRRLGATLRHGLANRYLTVVWQRDEIP